MAGRHRNTRGLWLRGEQRQREGTDEVAEIDARPADAVKPIPSWNDSTRCIQTIQDGLMAKGWGKGEVPRIPMAETAADELPERPEDFGVGWWR